MSAHANATQIGGSHYKDLAIEPWDFHFANRLLWAEGEIIKYVTRWKSKGGVNDLRKAEHIIQKMIYAAVNFDWPNRPLTDLELAQLMNLDVTQRDEPAGNYTVDTDAAEVRVSPETRMSALVEALRMDGDLLNAMGVGVELFASMRGNESDAAIRARGALERAMAGCSAARRHLEAFKDIAAVYGNE